MTRDEAVDIWISFGSARVEAFHRRYAPEHIVDKCMELNAQDCIDGLIALGLLTVDAPQSSGEARTEVKP